MTTLQELTLKNNMKFRFRNFTRLGANFPSESIIAEELVRKPKVLVAWEFIQFLLALALSIIITFTLKHTWVLIPLPMGYFFAAILLALDNYRYRLISSITVTANLLGITYLILEMPVGYTGFFVGLALIFFLIAMYAPKKSRAYFLWCRSVAKDNN